MFLPVAHWAMYTLCSTHCGPLGRLYRCSCHTAPLARRCWCAGDTGAPSAGRHRPHAGTSSESLTTELKQRGEKRDRTARMSVRGGRGVREGYTVHAVWHHFYPHLSTSHEHNCIPRYELIYTAIKHTYESSAGLCQKAITGVQAKTASVMHRCLRAMVLGCGHPT